MVRSRNWSDLGWQISKIRDIQVVSEKNPRYTSMTLWNAEGLKPIGYLVWPLGSLKVRNPFLTLTWPGDLTFGDLELKFLHKVSNSIVSRYWKNGGAARRRFSAIREKPEGWAFFAPPPSSARVREAGLCWALKMSERLKWAHSIDPRRPCRSELAFFRSKSAFLDHRGPSLGLRGPSGS